MAATSTVATGDAELGRPPPRCGTTAARQPRAWGGHVPATALRVLVPSFLPDASSAPNERLAALATRAADHPRGRMVTRRRWGDFASRRALLFELE